MVDRDNDTIRKVTPAGVVTTFAGTAQVGWTNVGANTFYRLPCRDGTGTTMQFGAPSGLAMDSADNLYVADQAHSTIRNVTPAGMVTTLAGKADVVGSADGTGSTALFHYQLVSSLEIPAKDDNLLADSETESATLWPRTPGRQRNRWRHQNQRSGLPQPLQSMNQP